jgi:hypothetical protein
MGVALQIFRVTLMARLGFRERALLGLGSVVVVGH